MANVNGMIDVSFRMAALQHVRTVNGEAVYVDWSKVPQNIIGQILAAATNVQLNNSFNSGGKDKPESERLAAMQKKIDAWQRGEVYVSTRGDSDLTAMKEQFIDEAVDKTGKSRAQVERDMAATCEKVFGEKSGSFDRFLSAVATVKAGKDGDADAVKQGIVADLWERTSKALAERAKAAESIDLGDLL